MPWGLVGGPPVPTMAGILIKFCFSWFCGLPLDSFWFFSWVCSIYFFTFYVIFFLVSAQGRKEVLNFLMCC